jgi:hypothetical protein
MQEVEKVRPLPEFATNHGLGNVISFSFFKKKKLKSSPYLQLTVSVVLGQIPNNLLFSKKTKA